MSMKPAALSVLDNVSIAAPCDESWEDMTGDETARHCDSCSLSVYNLSEMTREEAEALIIEREGSLCVRFYQRADGMIITRDCPIGTTRRSRRRMFFGAVFATLSGVLMTIGYRVNAKSAAQCATTASTSAGSQNNGTLASLVNVEPFKSLAQIFPGFFPKPPPPPHRKLMGKIAMPIRPTPNLQNNSGNTTP
jgi:hypothetical protein